MSHPPDKILISGIDCVAAIGVTPEERTIRQRLSIDIELIADVPLAASRDSLKDAIDYASVADTVVAAAQSRPFHLIETLADLIARDLLSNFHIPEVRVLVRKLTPVMTHRVSHVSVEITRRSPEEGN